MALPSAWAKSLLPLDQRHCHWRKWRINDTVFREGSDGGIHILHKRHIASIEPVCTSTDVPSRFFLLVQKIPLLWLQLKCFNLWSLHNRGYTGAHIQRTNMCRKPFGAVKAIQSCPKKNQGCLLIRTYNFFNNFLSGWSTGVTATCSLHRLQSAADQKGPT